MKKICPLPWLHFSAHLDSTMRICCNTDGPGFVYDNEGKSLKLSEVSDVKSYFNLNQLKDVRAKMINGEEPEICRKCFEVENYGGQSVRQGYLSQYAQNPAFMRSLETTNSLTGEITPEVQSLDFSLSNLCNLKCVMCSPSASYPIKADYDKLGIEYSKEFTEGARNNWKDLTSLQRIIPEIAPTLVDFLTTGGEPFLSNEHLKILEMIVESGNAENVNLSYHTNCTVKNEKLFEIWHKFRSVSVHFSIDAFGPVNEYVRFRTKWKDVNEIVGILTAHPKTRCEVHSTIQALNVFGLPELYEWMKTIPRIPSLPFHIWMDQPNWLRMDVLPPQVLFLARQKLEDYFKQNPGAPHDHVRQQQIISYIHRSMGQYQGPEMLAEFRKMVRQFEGIRGQAPIETLVPELAPIFN